MFSEWNIENFPLVRVKINSKINQEEFEEFKHNWENCYTHQQMFTLLFDTTNVGMLPIKYCFRTAAFIKKLKKKSSEEQYLEKSIIYVSNNTVLTLLKIIFYLTPPIAPVYFIKNNDEQYVQEVLDIIDNNDSLPKDIFKITP